MENTERPSSEDAPSSVNDLSGQSMLDRLRARQAQATSQANNGGGHRGPTRHRYYSRSSTQQSSPGVNRRESNRQQNRSAPYSFSARGPRMPAQVHTPNNTHGARGTFGTVPTTEDRDKTREDPLRMVSEDDTKLFRNRSRLVSFRYMNITDDLMARWIATKGANPDRFKFKLSEAKKVCGEQMRKMFMSPAFTDIILKNLKAYREENPTGRPPHQMDDNDLGTFMTSLFKYDAYTEMMSPLRQCLDLDKIWEDRGLLHTYCRSLFLTAGTAIVHMLKDDWIGHRKSTVSYRFQESLFSCPRGPRPGLVCGPS
ncbi:uncharacterized protein EI97DRAFT_502799 [Westerdykella ornata]|uniref:Uncharacterized protein n=1 Tax=Westerdykella ornata TaxID=318751 RepID=A0A6A6JD04_WESOR|nr:uncharacterized protein EI97DRAFT_502799 [Westerdykella ornata]KAF2274441.1 hypothetical protein EI97DRAFT_502799 [Westerdykella ornata]